MRRVVVTGLGAVTPLGVGIRKTWSNLIHGGVGVVSLKHRFADREHELSALPSQVAGLVPRGHRIDGRWDVNEWLSGGRDSHISMETARNMLLTGMGLKEQHQMADFTQYAMAAAEEAIHDSGCLPRNDEQREAMGVSIGSGIGNFEDVYNTSIAYSKGGYKKVSPLFVPRLLINLAAGHVAMKYGLQGSNSAPTTACTTGAHAIGDAARLIAAGDANIMIAGASEACVHPLAIAGFARARSLATAWNDNASEASRPFDKRRGGFVMGEGAGILVLEELSHALARKASIHAELIGYGQSCDASHMTAPLPSGHGAALAMRRALLDAKQQPAAVDYVNAHATSTALGDLAENKAIQDVLLGRTPSAQGLSVFKTSAAEINVSSTKGAMGHLLGAAGAVEAIFSILAVRDGVLPPTANLQELGDEKDSQGLDVWGCNYVPTVAQERKECHVALSNSFGFGGTNASLCFGRWQG